MSSLNDESFWDIVAMNMAMHNKEYRCDYLDRGLLPVSLQLVIADANRWRFVRYTKIKGVPAIMGSLMARGLAAVQAPTLALDHPDRWMPSRKPEPTSGMTPDWVE
jgi:hypothetical protein